MQVFRLAIMIGVLAAAAVMMVACGNGTSLIRLEGTDALTFSTDTLNVKPGETVQLTLVNNGKLDHTFTAPDLNIEFQMPAGKTTTETFVVSQPGEYRFYCAVIGHFDTMKGAVIAR